jgi:voltage-gated potassium channel
MLDIAVVTGAFATIPLTLFLEQGFSWAWLPVVDWTVWGVFLAEFVFKVIWGKVDRGQKLFLLTVVAVSFPALPAILGLVRVVRLVRVIRVSRVLRLARVVGVTARGIEGLRTVFGRTSVVYIGALSILIILAGGGGIALLEPETVHGGFWDGVWWAIVTASTVGYGDIAPTTLLGRSIAVVLMLTGVGLISTLAASITTHFLGQEENEELTAIRLQLTRIETLLSRMQVQQSTNSPEESSQPTGNP